jgi:predicted nucleic acid-binding protein
MIAVDTSSLSAFLRGETGPDVDLLANALAGWDLVLPPVVVTEILSDPSARQILLPQIEDLELLEILAGYWQRAGNNRRILKQKGLRTKIADALIAQTCIDHGVALISRDKDFRHFAKHCGLKLA